MYRRTIKQFINPTIHLFNRFYRAPVIVRHHAGHCGPCPHGQVKPWAEPPVGKPSNSERGGLSRPLPGKLKAQGQSPGNWGCESRYADVQGRAGFPDEPFTSAALDDVISSRTIRAFYFRPGRDTGDHLAVPIHFTNRRVRFRGGVSFAKATSQLAAELQEELRPSPGPCFIPPRGDRGPRSAPGAGESHRSGSRLRLLETERGQLFGSSHAVLYGCAWGTLGRGGGLAGGVLGSPCFSERGSLVQRALIKQSV